MDREPDIKTPDESVPVSVKFMMLLAFLVLLYVLVVDVFGFASLI